MLLIRLLRIGKKNQPSFRLVLTEKTAPPRGKFLEVLGSYNPRLKQISLKEERIKYWLSQGVQTSNTVHNLLVKQGMIKGPKRKKKIKSKKKMKTGVETERSPDESQDDTAKAAPTVVGTPEKKTVVGTPEKKTVVGTPEKKEENLDKSSEESKIETK